MYELFLIISVISMTPGPIVNNDFLILITGLIPYIDDF